MDDELTAIEKELLEQEEEKQKELEGQIKNIKETENAKDTKETKEVEFVKQDNPKISTSYKDKLIKVYEDLENVDKDDLEKTLQSIKEELMTIIKELDASEERIERYLAERANEKNTLDNDLHYLPTTKKKILHKAREKVFTPSVLISLSFFLLTLILGIVIFAVM